MRIWNTPSRYEHMVAQLVEKPGPFLDGKQALLMPDDVEGTQISRQPRRRRSRLTTASPRELRPPRFAARSCSMRFAPSASTSPPTSVLPPEQHIVLVNRGYPGVASFTPAERLSPGGFTSARPGNLTQVFAIGHILRKKRWDFKAGRRAAMPSALRSARISAGSTRPQKRR
jgi:hypothetical protein